jgi:hypothetical protein
VALTFCIEIFVFVRISLVFFENRTSFRPMEGISYIYLFLFDPIYIYNRFEKESYKKILFVFIGTIFVLGMGDSRSSGGVVK